MSSFLRRISSAAQAAALRCSGYLGHRAFDLLSRVSVPFIAGYYTPSEPEKGGDDPEANNDDDLVGAASTSACETYTMRLRPQFDLETVGVGASGQVYEVSGQIVLKTSWIFEEPGEGASDKERWHYASDTLFHSNLLQNERTALQLLQQWPHFHIMEVIDADQPEGIYLRRYHPLSEHEIPIQLHRIHWYCALTDALRHLHSLGIVHADVRVDNVLFDKRNRLPVLCDFSASSPIGQPHPVFPDLPLPVNGPSSTLSETTDMFAMGSLIFQMEHGGAKPELSVDSHGSLTLPKVQSTQQSLDTIIRKAWLGHYSCTSEMLEHLLSIDTSGARLARGAEMSSVSTESLRDCIRKWRMSRDNKFGESYPLYEAYLPLFLWWGQLIGFLGCVIDGILSEDQLQALADRYSLDKDADLRFTGARV